MATDGQGKPGQAPPLAKSEFALANPNRVIPIPLVGLVGRITVVGQVWDAQMLAMGATLSDEELSAVLTYIRKSWGNNGSEINAAQVKEVRTELANHPQITPEQLNARPEK
jgi:mono/diheme cytochrome c family protein